MMRFRAFLIAVVLAASARPEGRAYMPSSVGPSFSSGAAQSQNDAPYRATLLIRRWRVIINSTFEDRRASAEEPVLDAIEIAISPGAVRAVRERATEEQLKTADANAKILASAIVSAGERQPDGSVSLSEGAVDAGFKNACPIYPFC